MTNGSDSAVIRKTAHVFGSMPYIIKWFSSNTPVNNDINHKNMSRPRFVTSLPNCQFAITSAI